VREPGFLLIGRDDPDVVGELPRNLLEQLDTVRFDAIVVDDEDAGSPSLAGGLRSDTCCLPTSRRT
jgi:hypothetical protein